MHLKRAKTTKLVLGGFAALGVVVAHHLAYLIVAPGGHHRAKLLEHTGHEAWPYVLAFTLGVYVASLSGAIAAAAGSRSGGYMYRMGAAFSRLLLLQAGGYAVLEVLERTFSGDVVTLPMQPVLWIGLALQVLTALIGALLLGALVKAVTWLARRVRRPKNVARILLPKPALSLVVRIPEPATGAGSMRGPPIG
jgi:hypothetical protein